MDHAGHEALRSLQTGIAKLLDGERKQLQDLTSLVVREVCTVLRPEWVAEGADRVEHSNSPDVFFDDTSHENNHFLKLRVRYILDLVRMFSASSAERFIFESLVDSDEKYKLVVTAPMDYNTMTPTNTNCCSVIFVIRNISSLTARNNFACG